MSIEKDISKLLDAKVIDASTAKEIAAFYKRDVSNSSNRILVVFGVIGSILIGLGVILILAHNWDQLSILTKNIISFTPLILSQILCGIVLFKPIDKVAWRESVATLLFFGVGASIALISQVYHLPSDMNAYLLSWMILAIPIVYVFDSRAVSILCIIGLTFYGMNSAYFARRVDKIIPIMYWVLLLVLFPFYIKLAKEFKQSNATKAHHWFMAMSLCICFNSFFNSDDSNYVLSLVSSISALGIFYGVGQLPYFQNESLRNNPYKVIGSVMTIMVLFVLSFDFYWKYLAEDGLTDLAKVPFFDIVLAVLVSCICLVMFLRNFKTRSESSIKPIELVFLFFIASFFIGLYSAKAFILINILLLVIGVLIIVEGTKLNHLGVLNYGLLVVSILVTCRFFDSNLSFFIRGILFVLIGIGFFLGNYWFLNKRKQDVE